MGTNDTLHWIREWARTFKAEANQLKGYAQIGGWMQDRDKCPDPRIAAQWANAGFTPEEAFPLIEAGVTPEMAAAGDESLVAEHGIIGAAILKVQLEHPGATVLVEPDVEEPQ